MKDIIRHIAGYTIGIAIFVFLIPCSLIDLSRIDHETLKIGLIDSESLRILISLPFFLVGAIFMIWSNIFLFMIGKGGPADGFNISISPRTKKLVTNGPYRYSRNPMVFGAFLLYFSLGIFLNSIICLSIVLIFILFVINYLRFAEEKRLLKDFGDEYKDYRNKVSMIFPLRRLKKE
jgi:protein-S-isoprenylcysteine O-methyltransferase Ste14